MPTKIPVNGFGRLGKMLAMSQTWPYLMGSQRRMMTQSMKEQDRRDIEGIDRLYGLDREAQKTYVLTRKPDNSLAIHLSESDVTDIVVDTSDIKEAIECAVNAREKQIPKKPKKGVCPNCSSRHVYAATLMTAETFEYCGDCGQALDWSVEND